MPEINTMSNQYIQQTLNEHVAEKVVEKMVDFFADFMVEWSMAPTPTLEGQAPDPTQPVLEAPNLDNDSLALLLLDLRNKINELQAKTSKEDIQISMTKKQEMHQKQIEKIQDFIDKMKESKASNLAMKIFGWVAAAVMLVAAVAATVATGGAAAPLIVAAVVGLAVMALEESGAMEKITEGIAKLLEMAGMDEKAAKIVAQVSIMVVVLAVEIGCMIASGGMSAANVGAGLVDKVGKSVKLAANAIRIGAEVASGCAMVGQGAATIAGSVQNKQAMDAKADSLEFQKMMKKLQAMLEEEMDRLKEIIDQIESGISDVLQILGASADLNRHITQQMV
ncbi:MAG: type III secretion system translocon subunit SctE [Desulfobacterales bacterium]|nr:type III secretion system translocon subunit SctE [Desulfobacterales bacterium]